MLMTQLFPLSLHDALPIFAHEVAARVAKWQGKLEVGVAAADRSKRVEPALDRSRQDRKSTRLNSSHLGISYAVFCLKKKKVILAAISDDSNTYVEKPRVHT